VGSIQGVIPAAYGYELGIVYCFILLCLALVAHGIWVMRTGLAVWLWPVATRLAVILAAAVTPVVSFFGALVIQHFRRQSAFSFMVSRWIFIMPFLAFCEVLYLAMRQNWRYADTTQAGTMLCDFYPVFLRSIV
jgi:hypothetical protein